MDDEDKTTKDSRGKLVKNRQRYWDFQSKRRLGDKIKSGMVHLGSKLKLNCVFFIEID